ncbi:hypothetical protein AALA78_14775 [Lachnospiraceae bacterium 42-17]|jgi:flagellar assembly protein FliH
MKSLPRIVKEPEKNQDIKPFDFFAGFKIKEDVQTEEQEDGNDVEETDGPDPNALVEAENEILEEARRKAGQILSDAREQAEYLRQQGYDEGIKAGREDGYKEAYDEQQRILEQKIREIDQGFAEAVKEVSIEKDKILEKYIDDLKRISLAVAEKIIQTSLQSSGDIIKRMILAATDKLRKKQWAKIYVTKCESGISMEVDTEFLEALSGLSDNIKIITMDNGEDGTCIIELPDEIIDASVGTQLENIKDILNNVRA